MVIKDTKRGSTWKEDIDSYYEYYNGRLIKLTRKLTKENVNQVAIDIINYFNDTRRKDENKRELLGVYWDED